MWILTWRLIDKLVRSIQVGTERLAISLSLLLYKGCNILTQSLIGTMAYAVRRSAGRSPALSQEDDSPDEQGNVVNEESVFFNEANSNDGFLIRDSSPLVKVHPSSERQLSDQCKFRFEVIVDFGWESQYIPGRLLATHIGNKFIAYIVKVNGIGAVRIIDLATKERCLMKVEKGIVKDVEFMHKAEEVFVGFVDEYGTFYVNKIHKDTQQGKLSYHQVFKVVLDQGKKSDYRRFIWCKFVPDELSEVASLKDCAYQFAVLLDDMIYAGNVLQLISAHDEGCYTVNELRNDLIIIDTHSGPVTDASFAPDGTALATASKDGTVKFFQIYFQDKDRNPPRCLYSWEPHGGKPIDRLMFLDNHSIKPSAESQYWKFMITCTENMTEMKLFTCKTWECLQTIHFADAGQWKMEIDVTAHFILAADINRKAIYLLHFDRDDETARLDWIREFSLPFSVLSYNLAHVSCLRMKDVRAKGIQDLISGDPDDYKPDGEMVYLEANIVHPKSLQRGILLIDPPQMFCRSNGHHITFKPHVSYQEVNKETETDEPTLADDEDDDEDILDSSIVSNKSSTQISNPRLDEEGVTSPLNSLLSHSSLGGLRKKTSLSPILDPSACSPVAPSVAQMSEQLSSLIGISPGGGSTTARPPSSGHGTNSSHRTKTPSPGPTRQTRSNVDDYLIPRDISSSANGNMSKASSSSSPSREVEEILSPKINDMISHRSEATMDGLLALNTETMDNGNLANTLLTAAAETHFQNSAIPKQNTSLVTAPEPELVAAVAGQIADNVSSMMDIVQGQTSEMQDLKREIGRIHGALKQSDDIHALRKVVESYFKDSQARMARLEDTIKKMEAQERVKATQNVIPPNLSELLAVNIGNVVKNEIETVVPQALQRVYEPSKIDLHAQVDRVMVSLEAKLTQSIAVMLQQNKFLEPITNHFKATTKSVFEQTFNEIFTNTVYPRCQNVAQEMFNQVNEAFGQGTTQYVKGLQETLEAERKKDKTSETMRAQFNNLQDALSSVLQVEVETQMLRIINGIQGSIVRLVEESISRELAQAFQEQKKYFELTVLPRTVTPAVSTTDHYGSSPNVNDPVQIQRSLLAMAKNGDIVNAFVQACNYGDLQVLMHLCKNMPPAKVFESKLPHQTHVSILQQMATDIQQDTETKLAYLNAAIGSLDTTDRKTLQSVARVLPVFQASVTKFITQNPESKLISNIKLLEMALMGLCQSLGSPQVQGRRSQGNMSQDSFY